MAVPTSVATSISYKGVDYAFGTPIVFTELKPTIIVTFDVGDATGATTVITNGTQYATGFVQRSYFSDLDNAPLGNSVRLELETDSIDLDVTAYNTEGEGTLKNWTISVSLATGAEDSWQYLAGFVLRDTLIAELETADLAIITEDSVYKIAWEGADESWSQPYLVTQIITGGDLNSAQVPYAEMLWRVVVHTPSLAIAGQMENAIHKALARATATVNFSGVTQAGEIEEVTPVTDRYQVQNVPLYVSGGIYRLRLAKG